MTLIIGHAEMGVPMCIVGELRCHTCRIRKRGTNPFRFWKHCERVARFQRKHLCCCAAALEVSHRDETTTTMIIVIIDGGWQITLSKRRPATDDDDEFTFHPLLLAFKLIH
jgi:hypothetical protein